MLSHAPTMNTHDGQQKFTRYKSVRKTSRSGGPQDPHPSLPEVPPSAEAGAANNGLSRSMSRYKRPRAQTTGTHNKPTEQPEMPKMSLHSSQQGRARNGASSARPRNASVPPGSHSQSQSQSQSHPSTKPRVRTNTGVQQQQASSYQQQQQQQQQQQAVWQSPPRQPRRNTQSSRGQAPIAGQAVMYVDPQTQMSQAGQYVVNAPAYSAQGQMYVVPMTEEDRVRQMIEADKARQKRLREEQKQREAALAAEKAEKVRQEEEAERKKEEAVAQKAKEERLVKDKLEEAKRQHAERKKQQSRGLFSRGSQSARTERTTSNEYSRRYDETQEVPTPISEEPELPSERAGKVVARPYQSPPRVSKIRKESISSPVVESSPSATTPKSPPRFRKESISQPVSVSPPRPSVSQRPADVFFDAPKSNANTGERSIIVYYGETKAVIDIDVNTTAEDLLRSAAREMPKADVDPSTDVLMECFSQQEHQGLERRMRRYEIVAKIMDSWDFDRKNRFSIIKGNVGGTDSDLYLSSVTRRGEPKDTAFARMYYSSATPTNKPSWGTFDKPQTCFLRPDGQILVGKSDDQSAASSACHMADFEIFIPTPEQMKRIKPKSKKMYVFAVKSQSKAAVYMESNNYVHYFCTKDKADADRWFVALQSWRSWYMVEKLGYGKAPGEASGGWIGQLSIEKGNEPAAKPANGSGVNASRALGSGGGTGIGGAGGLLGSFMDSGNGGEDIFSSIMHKYDNMNDGPDLSKDALGYDLGGLISRIPVNEHSYGDNGTGGGTNTVIRTASVKPLDRRGGPPSSFPASMMSEEQAFAPGGLLGRSYSQRKAQVEAAGRSSLDQRPRFDQHQKQEKDWGKPLIDFSGESEKQANATAGQARRGFANDASGPLIGRI